MFFSRNSSSVDAIIKSGSLKKLQKLIDATNCNALDEQQRAPLYYAILYQQAEIAAWLLSLGCDVDSGAENADQYVMEFVVSQLSEPLLNAFIDHGETLPSYIDGMPLLHALMDHEKITERYFALVLAHGADINTIDLRATNQTVLAYYVGQEQVRVDTLKVAWLIKLGADVNKAETPKNTPLMRTITNPALLDAQTKLNATTVPRVLEQLAKNGDLTLDLVVFQPTFPERILQYRRYASFVKLLEMGLNVAEKDRPGLEKYLSLENFGRSDLKALQAVNEQRQLGLPLGIMVNNVRQMQQVVAEMPTDGDVNKTFVEIFKAGNIPLEKKLAMLTGLIDKGADINQGIQYAGMTLSPLQILCGWMDNFEYGEQIFDWLLDNGAQLECHERSALFMALWFERMPLVSKLAARGANLNFRGADGSNIFTWLFTMTPRGGGYDIETRVETLRSLGKLFTEYQQPLPFTEEFSFNFDSPTDLSERAMLPALLCRYSPPAFMAQTEALLDIGWDINREIVDSDGERGTMLAIWGQYAKFGHDISPLLNRLDVKLDVSSPTSGNPLRSMIAAKVALPTIECLLQHLDNIDQTFRRNIGNRTTVAVEHSYIYHALDRCYSEEGDADKYQYCADVCRLLLAHGADANGIMKRELQPDYQDDGRGWGQYRTEETLLEAAGEFNNIDVFRALLDHGADPHKPMCVTGEVFEIYMVSRFRHPDPAQPVPFLEELAKRGMLDVNVRNSINNSPLLAASSKCYTALVQFLLEHGADVNACGGFDNSMPLHRAISNWNFIDKEDRRATVEVLLAHGADANGFDPDGDTPLMCAAAYGCLTAVEALLAHGVDVNIANPAGFTALHNAAWRPFGYDNHVEYGRDENCIDQGLKKQIINLLLEHGADINAATKEEGYTPLTVAMLKDHADIFVRLMKRGADLNKADAHGRTPLMIAVKDCHERYVNFLCGNPVVREKVEQLDGEGSNLMHYIAQRQHSGQALEMFQLFTRRLQLSFKANDSQITPLHYAAFRGHAELINEMAALGIDVNAADDSGNSALHVALFFDSERMEYQKVQAVVRNLLAAGANPRLENQEGLSPLALASQRELRDCVELMNMVPVGMSVN
ncbi:ankyrin repeat domain-containing protein [Shewanella sp. C32]|uniref:Ankyrin repeat domain-containing protein n=1 Tax=Shewanella electrica TaxID=515560 RepID=A0ABT2FI12_9GAMM|nr:ankyrin repeat domain-containing protein [Shewanella electrica]MCH1923524.1 ankyrin repeat domain-containing protein [Shewanella electrica]MCS4555621.1 ankyrin repeat domain-containing protein [Shewanella electrica]